MIRLLPLLLVAGLLGCDGKPPAGGGPPPPPEGLVVRPGDSLFRLAESVRVERYPDTNLPPDMAERAEAAFAVRSPLVARGAWIEVSNVPPGFAAALADLPELRLWRARPPLKALRTGVAPTVLWQGRPAPYWDLAGGEEFPGLYVWWDANSGHLLAVSAAPPEGVALDAWVDPDEELGDFERRRLAGTSGEAEGRPRVEALVERWAFGDVTRPALLLPTGGALALDIDRLEAERLELDVCVWDKGWRVVGESVHRGLGLGDGASFVVTVTPRVAGGQGGGPSGGGSVTAAAGPDTEDPAASAPPPVARDGTSFRLDVTTPSRRTEPWQVDLSPWRGEAVTLTLATEAGPGGEPWFDWALWADLAFRGGEAAPPPRPHVVLIDCDTLRADRLAAYGGQGVMPRLDAWAEGAMVYTDAVSPASWTLPATASMLTGLALHQHGVVRASGAVGEGAGLLAERLRDAGYETRAVAAGGYLRPTFGFDAGFDHYETVDPKAVEWDEALAWLDPSHGQRPVFLFLHTYRVHAPYPHDPEAVDPAYAGELAGVEVDYPNVIDPVRLGQRALGDDDLAYVEDLYDALAAGLDADLGHVLETIAELVSRDDVLVIFTSDHGEAFLEHGVIAHGQALWDELLRVPLVVAYPDGRAGLDGRAASLVDLVPTVLDVVGLPVPEGLAGVSLRAPPDRRRPRVRVSGHQDAVVALHSEHWKLLRARPEGPTDGRAEVATLEEAAEGARQVLELFDLGADPGETTDLSTSRADVVRDLLRRLDWFEQAYPPPSNVAIENVMDADDVEQLRALGYLGDN